MEYPFKSLMPLDEATARDGYYKDWTHIDADTFHQISELVKFIREKGYGSDTREAFAQALERVYHDAAMSGNANMEVSMARKHFKDLASRLGASDDKLNSATAQLAQKVGGGKLATLNDFDEETLNFIHDGTGGPISVESTPKNSSVTPLKIDGFEGKNFNLYVPSDHLVKGFFINATAQIITDAVNGAYAKVLVKGSEYYSLWRADGRYTPGNGVLVFQDENGDTISFIELNAYRNGVYRDVPYITFQTPPNTTHVLFNTKLGTFDSSYDSILVEGRTLSDELFRNKEVLKLFGADLVDLKTKGELNDFIASVKGTGGNLYNKASNHVEGMYVSTNGSILPAAGWSLADVPISEYSIVSIWKPDGNFGGQIGAIGFYKDDEKLGYSYVPETSGYYEGVGFVTLTLPAGTNRLLITTKASQSAFDNSDGLIVVEGEAINNNVLEARLVSVNGYDVPKIDASQSSKPYLDVKWTVVGDSLTETNSRSTKFYHEYIADELGFDVTNMGVSGTGYARTSENNTAFYQRINNIPLDTEVVTIFGSFNDLGSPLPLGTSRDTGTETIAGCINTTLDNLNTKLPLVPVGIIAPTPWHTTRPWLKESQGSLYVELLIQICMDRGLPLLDLYHTSGLRPWEESYRTLVYDKDPVGNGTHPNEIGHELISKRVREFVKTLI